MSDLALTGERMHPEYQWGDRTMREHYARYFLATQLVGDDARVLDIACGEGYGSELLMRSANCVEVLGVDLSPEAVNHARMKYRPVAGAAGLYGPTYEVGDIQALDPNWSSSFDLVVSFETIEHVAETERALKELRRVLKPDGYLVISTPNKGVYPAGNPFHLRELTTAELVEGLVPDYDSVQVWRQDWSEGTVLRPLEPLSVAANSRSDRQLPARLGGPMAGIEPPEHYVVAVCGPAPVDLIPIVVL